MAIHLCYNGLLQVRATCKSHGMYRNAAPAQLDLLMTLFVDLFQATLAANDPVPLQAYQC